MATIYPEDAAYHQPDSAAERALYQFFAQLPNDYTSDHGLSSRTAATTGDKTWLPRRRRVTLSS